MVEIITPPSVMTNRKVDFNIKCGKHPVPRQCAVSGDCEILSMVCPFMRFETKYLPLIYYSEETIRIGEEGD